ncbi:hypothetical protein EYC84_002029 [Monilinia fructicola]|uniref:Uncharacterized protein n=1 Tax=Monilinia fructicola TaxID=38448 RepID=A0A5M9JW46_MONFR|nr:hypothetical protein EYC84_002029 [Monilinia fructicola]
MLPYHLQIQIFPLNCLPFPVHFPIEKRPAPDATLLLYKQVFCALIDPRSLMCEIMVPHLYFIRSYKIDQSNEPFND